MQRGYILIMWENIFGIFIVLIILFVCLLMMYLGLRNIYKIILKPKYDNETEFIKELDSLKQRVEMLERKINN